MPHNEARGCSRSRWRSIFSRGSLSAVMPEILLHEEAARDPVFMQDMHEVDADWDITSSDGLDAAD